MSAPTTTEEIRAQIAKNSHEGYRFLAHLIQQWLTECRANAEPRLRPVSEKPER